MLCCVGFGILSTMKAFSYMFYPLHATSCITCFISILFIYSRVCILVLQPTTSHLQTPWSGSQYQWLCSVLITSPSWGLGLLLFQQAFLIDNAFSLWVTDFATSLSMLSSHCCELWSQKSFGRAEGFFIMTSFMLRDSDKTPSLSVCPSVGKEDLQQKVAQIPHDKFSLESLFPERTLNLKAAKVGTGTILHGLYFLWPYCVIFHLLSISCLCFYVCLSKSTTCAWTNKVRNESNLKPLEFVYLYSLPFKNMDSM